MSVLRKYLKTIYSFKRLLSRVEIQRSAIIISQLNFTVEQLNIIVYPTVKSFKTLYANLILSKDMIFHLSYFNSFSSRTCFSNVSIIYDHLLSRSYYELLHLSKIINNYYLSITNTSSPMKNIILQYSCPN